MGALDMICGRLPPTATYAVREYRWVPGGADGRLGTLTLILQAAERNGRRKPVKVESDTYAVCEDTEPRGYYGLGLLLLNETDASQADVYRVVLGPACYCNCKAAQCKLECKHLAAAMDVLLEGGFNHGG